MSNVTECRTVALRIIAICCFLFLGALGYLTNAQVPAAPKQALVEVRTEMGTFIITLYNETPQHRDNFLKLVREQAYDSLLFHRIIKGFMVQGGDPDSRTAVVGGALGQGGPGYTLPAEIVPGLVHTRGALAAARQPDQGNPERQSNGSQFYIVQGKTFSPAELDQVIQRSARNGIVLTYSEEQKKDYATEGGAPHLDGGYTVFGKVVEGMDVVDAIAAVTCDGRDRPLTDIRMFMHVLE
ncbi:MAG: peptidylprolyl isomerase [Flavobacteriales bacterium]|nr:peptidylprolyl isomerase [Flavobacteriales bacterium]